MPEPITIELSEFKLILSKLVFIFILLKLAKVFHSPWPLGKDYSDRTLNSSIPGLITWSFHADHSPWAGPVENTGLVLNKVEVKTLFSGIYGYFIRNPLESGLFNYLC